MKKLFSYEVVHNKVEILIDTRGKTRFILARRNEAVDGDTRWGLFNGPNCLHISPYRADLICKLNDWGYAVKNTDSNS